MTGYKPSPEAGPCSAGAVPPVCAQAFMTGFDDKHCDPDLYDDGGVCTVDLVHSCVLQGFYPGGTAIAFRQMTNWASRQGFTEFVRDRAKVLLRKPTCSSGLSFPTTPWRAQKLPDFRG